MQLCLYFALYHEAVCANLLERCLLCGSATDDEDVLTELADYSVRAVRLAPDTRPIVPKCSLTRNGARR